MFFPVRPCLLVILGLFHGMAVADMPVQSGKVAGAVAMADGSLPAVMAVAAPQATARDAEQAPGSLARVIMAQANIPGQESVRLRSSGDGRSSRAARSSSSPQLPGALISVMFGVFGILVVARRNSRH